MKTRLKRDEGVAVHVWVDDRLVVDPTWHVYTSTDAASAYAVMVHPDTNATVKIRLDRVDPALAADTSAPAPPPPPADVPAPEPPQEGSAPDA